MNNQYSIRSLKKNIILFYQYKSYHDINKVKSRVININLLSDIWLVDCSEGIQQALFKDGFRLNQLSKIFIVNHDIQNLSGIVGLLATLNLAGRKKPFLIYSHTSVKKYIFAISKYSQTNFSFPIIFIDLEKQVLYQNHLYSLIFMPSKIYKRYSVIILNKQRSGNFLLKYAIKYGLRPSSIYQLLKNGKNFINWEGTIYKGISFCSLPRMGDKFIINSDFINYRFLIEILKNQPSKKIKENVSNCLYKENYFQEYR